MNSKFVAVVCGLCWLLIMAPIANAQVSPGKVQALQKGLDAIAASYEKFSPKQKEILDGYRNVLHASKTLQLAAANSGAFSRTGLGTGSGALAGPQAPGNVNARGTDQDFSGFDGVTQSETSTAVCGNQVVVGFNDSGSELQTLTFNGGLSFSGVAVSSDGGVTFKDLGFSIPGPIFLTLYSETLFFHVPILARSSTLNCS